MQSLEELADDVKVVIVDIDFRRCHTLPDSFDCRLTFCVPSFGADDVAVPSQDPARLIGSMASVFVDVG